MVECSPSVGIIGGSGIYALPGFTTIKCIDDIVTPWGKPNPISILTSPDGTCVAFLARHAPGHIFLPSHVPYRANIAALKSLGVRAIVAFTAVGSLREELRPGDFVLPSQAIDFTKGVRPHTYFDNGAVCHVSMARPFNATLRSLILKAGTGLEGVVIHRDRCGVTIEGPTFSTKAESEMFRLWGADIINMTAIPECKLAREAEVAYQPVAMVTDYDCWHPDHDAVTVDMVMSTFAANSTTARNLAASLVPLVAQEVEKGDSQALKEAAGVDMGIMTSKEVWDVEAANRLAFLHPKIFGEYKDSA